MDRIGQLLMELSKYLVRCSRPIQEIPDTLGVRNYFFTD